MASTHTVPELQKLPSKFLGLQHQLRDVDSINPILGLDWLLLKVSCPSHVWSWPMTLDSERHESFDARQICFKCTTERFFNTRLWQAGPMYRRKAPGNAKPSGRNAGLPRFHGFNL